MQLLKYQFSYIAHSGFILFSNLFYPQKIIFFLFGAVANFCDYIKFVWNTSYIMCIELFQIPQL